MLRQKKYVLHGVNLRFITKIIKLSGCYIPIAIGNNKTQQIKC